jgi:fatty acid desaturase
MLRGRLSRVDRGVSIVLAIVWLVAGLAGLAAGAIGESVPLMLVSPFVAAWGAAWAWVAWRGRPLGSVADRPMRRRKRGG